MFWKLPEIQLEPDVIFHLGPFPVTNTLLCTWISLLVLIAVFYFGTRKQRLIPSGLQNFLEIIVEFLLGLIATIAGEEKGKRFFALVATLFFFILASNLVDILPGVDSIGTIDYQAIEHINAITHTHNEPLFGFLLFGPISNALIPWFRPATTDLNLTLAMALTSVITAQIFGFFTLGAKTHLGKYFNVKALLRGNFEGFIIFCVGLLEILQEISRVISLTFRLFGNIFAGSIVLAIFAFLLPFIGTLLFIPFEIFVALVQAFVFALLTLVYLQSATTSHEHTDAHNDHISVPKK